MRDLRTYGHTDGQSELWKQLGCLKREINWDQEVDEDPDFFKGSGPLN